jgi:hypothetical protein
MPSGIFALRQLRMAVSYARTPNVELSAASAPEQVELSELGRSIAELRYGIVLTDGSATRSRLANARSHLDLAAASPGTPAALEQAIKAWDNLDG